MEVTLNNISNILKKISNYKFWISAITLTLIFVALGYKLGNTIIELNLIDKYESIDAVTKNFISIDGWWIETLIGGCIPMFLVFAIQFFVLRLDVDKEKRDFIYSVLPFIPKLKWLTNKPIYFMLCTAALLLGLVLFLSFDGDLKYLWGALIPATIFGLTFLVRYTSAQISSGKGFTNSTYKNCVKIAWFCLFLSFLCWGYSDVILPVGDAIELWKILTKS